MSLFGSPGDKYSQKEHQLTKVQIRAIVSRTRIRSLDQKEESAVEAAIEKARGGDGDIYLRNIYNTLRRMRDRHEISRTDFDHLMKVFVEYFKTHFGE